MPDVDAGMKAPGALSGALSVQGGCIAERRSASVSSGRLPAHKGARRPGTALPEVRCRASCGLGVRHCCPLPGR